MANFYANYPITGGSGSGGITALIDDVVGTGPGVVPTTIEAVQGNTVNGTTGTNNVVFSNSPTLVNAALGTPSALVGTNITGTGAGFTSGSTNALKSASTTVNVSSATAPTSGQILTATSGTAATWQNPATSGTVTSVAMTVPSVLSISGSPITSSGTLAVSYSGTALPVANGGTGVTSLGTLSDAGTDGIIVTGGANSVINNVSFAQHVADSTHNGYLSSTDWSTFNGKQASGNYITALTGDVTATGPGSVASTVAKIAGTAVSGTTGSTNVVFSTSPTLTAPILGTPQSGNLSNCTAYPNVTQSVAGLVASAGQLLGTNTNDNASSGNTGENVSATDTSNISQSSPSDGTFYDLSGLSISLTAGDWDISIHAIIGGAFTSGSGTAARLMLYLRDGSNNLIQAGQSGYIGDTLTGFKIPAIWAASVSVIARASIASTTTYKLSMGYVSVSGTPVIGGINARGDFGTTYIKARRVR